MKSSIRRLLHRVPRVRRLIKNVLCFLRREPKITWESIDDKDLATFVGRDDPVILDIGSNDGSQTLWFLRLFSKARVYSFEPDPRAQARYLKNVKDDRAILLPLAISETDGTREFFVSSGRPEKWPDAPDSLATEWDLSGSIRKPMKHLDMVPWCKFDTKLMVKTRTLDSWVREQGIGMIDFIWADVQGAEVDLIAGGKVALNNTRYFYTEFSNSELYEGQINLRQLLSLLPEFRIVRRYENDILLKNVRFE